MNKVTIKNKTSGKKTHGKGKYGVTKVVWERNKKNGGIKNVDASEV